MMMKRRILLGSASVMALGIGLSSAAYACVAVTSGATWSGTTSCVTWTGGNLTITNSGTISSSSPSVSVSVSSGTLVNSGHIVGSETAIDNVSGSTITKLINNAGATITTTYSSAISNAGRIETLTNNGVITGDGSGIDNTGTIDTLRNSGTISAGSYGLRNSASIATLSNSGTILSGINALYNDGGTIGLVTVSGLVNGDHVGLYNVGTIGTLINSGTISDSLLAAVYNGQTIGTIINQRLIVGHNGILNDGTILSLSNSGTIAATATLGNALANDSSAVLGVVTNSGLIAGNIENDASQNLTINGGSGSAVGTLTGISGSIAAVDKSLITNTASNLVFGSGNLLLNDDINVGGNTVINSGARLILDNVVSITANAYDQTSGALRFKASSPSSYAYLDVSGDATVSNSHVTIAGSGLSVGESFTVVRSGGTGTYADDTAVVATTNGLGATITTVGQDLVVTLLTDTSNTYTFKGEKTGGNAAPVGQALDQILANANGGDPTAQQFQTNVLTMIDALPLSQQGTAMKQLAPTQMVGGSLAINQVAAPAASVIEQHELALLSPTGSDDTGAAAGSDAHNKALWGELIGSFANRSSSGGAGGYASQDYGFVTGVDWQATPQAVVGLAVSYIKGLTWGADDTSGSFTGIDSYQITGYGLYRFGQAFVDGQAGFGFNHYDQSRAINFLGQSAHADYNGEQYLAKGGAGYDIPLAGKTVLTPLAGLRYIAVVNDSYSESGSSANLSVKQMTVQALTQDLGFKLSTTLDTPWGKLSPEGRIAWVHDYLNGDITTSATMAGVAFDAHTDRINPNGARLNLAATLDQASDMTLRAEYEGEFRSNYDSQTGLIKVSWGF